MKRTITKNKIEQFFNLRKLLGKKPTDRQKELFYELVVDKMVDRTVSGKDIDNENFEPYEPEYAAKKGVVPTSVDLVLSGEMLNSVEDSKTRDGVRIQIEKDQTGKAHGNITGSYGRSPNPDKARDFFGFKSENQIRDIIRNVKEIEPVEQEETGFEIDLAELRAAVAAVNIDFEDL